MTATTPLGQVLRDADGTRLRFVRTYAAPVADVWSALTDPERTARWIGPWSGDPATGEVQFVMDAEEGAPAGTVRIVVCDPPVRLVLDLPAPERTWRVDIELAVDHGGTTLTFEQVLDPADDPSSIGPGWHYYLDRLGAVVTGGSVPTSWEEYHPALSGAYSPA